MSEKLKVFRSMQPIDPTHVVRGQYVGYRDVDGVADESDTETFIALRVDIDNWRWAGVPFFLRTGKKLAEGARVISIAFKEPPRSMFPAGSGVGLHGPDHLTFDLADQSRMSLSFYGKKPGPGMKLEKLSMQFATHESSNSKSVLEAYERLIYDALKGDHTLFTTAAGIETLWERSMPLLQRPASGPVVPRGHVGAEPDPPARRAQRVAAAVRTDLAGPELLLRVTAAGCAPGHPGYEPVHGGARPHGRRHPLPRRRDGGERLRQDDGRRAAGLPGWAWTTARPTSSTRRPTSPRWRPAPRSTTTTGSRG